MVQAARIGQSVPPPWTARTVSRLLIRGGEWTGDVAQKYLNGPRDLPYPFAMSAISHIKRRTEGSGSRVAVKKEFRDRKDGQCDLPADPLQDFSFSPSLGITP